MKTLKMNLTLLFFLALMFTPLVLLAQEPQVPDIEEISFLDFIFKLVVALFPPILLGALATAANHLMAGTFKVKPWLSDTFWPAMIAYGIAIILGVIDNYVSVLDNFVEMIFQIETDVNDILALAGVAWVLVPMVKGIFKRQQTKEKVAVKRLAENN